MSKRKKLKFTGLKKFGKKLYKILDLLLITPISRIVYRINKLIKAHTGGFDGLFNNSKALIIISLVISFGIFFFVNIRSVNLVETESEILSSQPVNAIYNKEKYVIEGIPETVDIILMGRKSDLYLAKQLGDHKIVLDLSDYKTGEYTVKLKYNHSVASISYKLDPSSVTVKISEKESAVRTLTYDLLNQDKLDSKLNVSDVKLKESEVYVKGAKETLEKVATVKALIDVATLDLKESGTFDIDSLPMVAYDENGKVIDNVEIVPATASATIKIDSYYVDLPVRVVPVGKLATGYAINSATSSVTTLRVYGEQSVISSIPYIKAEVDVESLSSNKEYKVTLVKPSGVRYMSQTTATVNITVGTETTSEIELGSIDSKNLGTGYIANLVNEEDSKCIVIVKGVENVIKSLDASTVKAYVDLSGYGPGTYDVPVLVEGQDMTVTYIPKVQTIQVKITSTN